MPEPSQSSPAAGESLTDSQGPLDPTAPRPDGTLSEPNFAPPERAGEVGTFGRYRVLKKLGQGGMGAVYLGYDGALERKVALKVMLPRHAAGADARERFLREARSAAKIKSDHVVTIHDVGEERGVPFIAMEYLLGHPLDQYLKSKGELPLAQVLRVVRETAIGLAAAHGLGLVHRDVKPANLWLEAPNGRVKLLDFGLARATDDDVHLTNSGAVMGTPAYMSPEQGRGLKVDHRSDLFSLGVMLYRLCTGKMPFTGATTMAVLTSLGMDTPTPPRQLNPQLPEALEAIVTKLLAKNPAGRFQTATEVADALRTVEQAKPTSGPLPVVVPLPVQPLAVGAQTQNVWDGIEDSGSVAVPLADSAEAEPEPTPAPRPQRRRPERRASKWPALLAVGVLCAAVAVFVAVLLRPSNGTLIVESDDPDAELVIKKDGETVRDRTKDREFALPTGTYAVELADPKPGLKLDRDKVEIAKNGTSRVAVRLQKPSGPRPAAKPKDRDTPPGLGPVPDAVYPLPADLIAPMTPVKPAQVFALDHLDPAKHIPPEEKFDWQPKELVAVLGSHRQRLPGGPGALTVSPDGTVVLAGGHAVDVVTRKTLDWPPITAFSPDGKRGAYANKVWEIADLKKAPVEYPPQVWIVAFLTNDIVLTTGGDGYVAWKLDPKEPKVVENFRGVSSFAVSNDRKYLAVVFKEDQSCHVYAITPEGPKEKFVLPGAEGKVGGGYPVSFSETGLLAALDAASVVRVWDIAGTKPQVRHTIDEKGPGQLVCFFPKGDRVVRGNESGFEVWSIEGTQPRKLAASPGFVLVASNLSVVAVTPDGNTIITGHINGTVRFWGIEKEVIFERNPIRPSPSVRPPFADFSPDGRFAALYHDDNRSHIWKLTDLTSRALADPGEAAVRFAPDSATACTWRNTAGGGLRLVPSATPEQAPVDFASGFQVACYSPDGKWLAAWSATELSIWDVSVSPPKERFARVAGLHANFWRFTPDGRFLIAVGQGGVTKIWALTERGPILRQEITIPCEHFTLSPDGKTVAFCERNKGTAYYDFKDGLLALRREDKIGAAWADYSPDGRTLLVGGGSAGLKLLDATTRQVLQEWTLRGSPQGGRFHPDGRHLFVTNADATTYILRLPADRIEQKK